jgi:adenylate cyclase
VLAHVRLLDREFEAALEAGRRALLIRPGCANANGFFGNVLHYCGEQIDAITHIRKGIRLQPVYPPFFASTLATAYLATRQAESASAVAKEALRLNPRDLQSRFVLVVASQLAGNPALARVFAGEMLHMETGFSVRQYCNDQPYRDPATIHALVETGLAAGLPAE